MPISKALGKFAAKVAKQDQSGSVRKLVEEQSVMEKMVRMKKADLEDVAETGSSSEKYYAKQELKRRSQGVKAPSSDSRRDTIQKEIDRYPTGAGNKRSAGIDDDEFEPVKQRPGESDKDYVKRWSKSMGIDKIDEEGFRKGGMVKKAPAKKVPAKKPAVKKPAVKKPVKKGK
jgi:hypothetical protein